jgi:Putative transposase
VKTWGEHTGGRGAWQWLHASQHLIDWVVHSQSAGAGREALNYLSVYLFRTALSNKRLMSDQNGHITSGYIESQTGKSKTLVSMRSISLPASFSMSCPQASIRSDTTAGCILEPESAFSWSKPCSPCPDPQRGQPAPPVFWVLWGEQAYLYATIATFLGLFRAHFIARPSRAKGSRIKSFFWDALTS